MRCILIRFHVLALSEGLPQTKQEATSVHMVGVAKQWYYAARSLPSMVKRDRSKQELARLADHESKLTHENR